MVRLEDLAAADRRLSRVQDLDRSSRRGLAGPIEDEPPQHDPVAVLDGDSVGESAAVVVALVEREPLNSLYPSPVRLVGVGIGYCLGGGAVSRRSLGNAAEAAIDTRERVE